MKIVIAAAALLICDICAAAPFLVSDPYPLTGTQPASFNVQLDSAASVSVPAVVNSDGRRQLRYDVGQLTIADGAHTFKVSAVAPSGVGAPTNFPFTWPLPQSAPPPDSPVNLRLVP